MAVKKATKKEELSVEEVKVDEVVTEEPEVEVEEPEVEVEEPEVEFEETEVEVDTTVADVKNAPKEKNVRVKVKKDISFNFGNEKYVMKEGQCYNVPVAVKLHLNKFDALSPL